MLRFNWLDSDKRTILVAFLALILLPCMGTPSLAAFGGPEQREFTLDIPRGLTRAGEIQSVEVERGKTILLYTAFEVTRLAVGDPKIADFVAISGHEIEILAKTVGDTNLLVWGDGRLQAVVDIHVGTLQPQIVRELSRLLNNPNILVDVAGGSIILRGNVATLQEFEQATRVASAFLTRAREAIAGQDVAETPEVINLLRVGGDYQVMIEVVIAELSRNVRRALGVNLMGKATNGSTQAATFQTMLKNLTSNPEIMAGGVTPAGATAVSESVTMAASYFSSDSMDLRIFLEAVEANQLGSILARPTVVARSGEPANFLVGGEVPIPLVTNIGANTGSQYTVLFKKFGVNVEFLPTVLAEDRIHMQIMPEISEPDFSMGVSVLGQQIPSFRTRRVTTAVELGDGESFVLGGLLREDIIGDIEDVPFLSNVPMLGQLFRTRAWQKTQTELVLIVTPHLVQPIPPGAEFELPTDTYIEPTLLEFYWDGRIEGRAPISVEEGGAKVDDEGTVKHDDAWGAVHSSDDLGLASNDEMEPSVGGFVGPVGYRIESPRPTGGIQ